MEFVESKDGTIEIMTGGVPVRKVLEEMARLSYESASSPLPQFILPFEVEASKIDFSALVTHEGLKMDFLNGRLCSTFVEVKDSRLIFDANRFREDRGAPEAFLQLLEKRLENFQCKGVTSDKG